MSAWAATFQMRELRCGECGIVFWAPEYYMAERERTGKNWYCPNGHCRVYRETEAEQLKRQLADEQKRRWEAEEKHRLAVVDLQKKEREAKRLRKRASAGMCPCCNRTFQNMQRHMHSKHPDYTEAQ